MRHSVVREKGSRVAFVEFDSVNEVAELVKAKHRDADTLRQLTKDPEWYGDNVDSFEDIAELARIGWEDHVDEWMKIAEDTLEQVERAFDVPSWNSSYEVTGSDVDVARYLSGEPENMIQFHLIQSTRVGRVVSLAVNITASSMVKAETIEARGRCVMALIYALERIGIRTELYADMQVAGWGFGKSKDVYGRIITKVKDAGETLDPAMVSFALAHAAFFRGVVMPAMHEFPEEFRDDLDVGGAYGVPTTEAPLDGRLPEGTIEIESAMYGAWDRKKAEDFVVEHLKDLGMISD